MELLNLSDGIFGEPVHNPTWIADALTLLQARMLQEQQIAVLRLREKYV
jgi:hypothetical protein